MRRKLTLTFGLVYLLVMPKKKSLNNNNNNSHRSMTCRLRRRKKGKITNLCQSQTDCLARKGKIANLCAISYFLPALLLSTPFPLQFLSNERPERTENKKKHNRYSAVRGGGKFPAIQNDERSRMRMRSGCILLFSFCSKAS